jgi:hypothetical protein
MIRHYVPGSILQNRLVENSTHITTKQYWIYMLPCLRFLVFCAVPKTSCKTQLSEQKNFQTIARIE